MNDKVNHALNLLRSEHCRDRETEGQQLCSCLVSVEASLDFLRAAVQVIPPPNRLHADPGLQSGGGDVPLPATDLGECAVNHPGLEVEVPQQPPVTAQPPPPLDSPSHEVAESDLDPDPVSQQPSSVPPSAKDFGSDISYSSSVPFLNRKSRGEESVTTVRTIHPMDLPRQLEALHAIDQSVEVAVLLLQLTIATH